MTTPEDVLWFLRQHNHHAAADLLAARDEEIPSRRAAGGNHAPDDVLALAEDVWANMIASLADLGLSLERGPTVRHMLWDALAAALPGFLAERDPMARQFDGELHPLTCSGGGGEHSGVRLVWWRGSWRCPVQGCKHMQGGASVPAPPAERAAGGLDAAVDAAQRAYRGGKGLGRHRRRAAMSAALAPFFAVRPAGLDAAADAAVDELVHKTLAWQGRHDADVARARAAIAPHWPNRPESPDSSWPELLRIAGEALSDFDSLPEDQQDAGALAQALSDHGMPARVTEPTLADLRERLEGMSDRDLMLIDNTMNEAYNRNFVSDRAASSRAAIRAVLAELGRAHTEGDHG